MLTLRLNGGTVATGSPSSRTSPSVGCSKPAIMRSVVVLPQPDGPSSEKNSPSAIVRSRSSTAVAAPKRFVTPSKRTASLIAPSLPLSTPSPLSRRPNSRGSTSASAIASTEMASISVPIALIVGVTPKRIAD